MSNPFTDSFKAIDIEIANAIQANDTQKEIEVRGAKAAKHLIKFQFKDAAAELGKVAELVGKKGQIANAATARFAQARALAQMENGIEPALEAMKEAGELAGQAEDMVLRGDIALFHSKLHTIEEDFVAAYQAVSYAVQTFSLHSSDPQKLIEAYQMRAGIGVFLLQFKQVDQDFENGLELAKEARLAELVAEIEKQRSAAQLFADGELTAERLIELLKIGSQFGDYKFGMEPNLQNALEKVKQRKFAAAGKLAQKSLGIARQDDSTTGYIRYLAASFVLAEIHAATDEKVDVLKVLLRCKVYIEQQFAPSAGLFVNQYLNSFQQRWGAETLQQTIQEYQAWVAENGPIEA